MISLSYDSNIHKQLKTMEMNETWRDTGAAGEVPGLKIFIHGAFTK